MKLKNNKGFTLIEMLIVLFIISILLLITIPNISTNNSVIEEKGCDALLKLAEAQAQAYRLDQGHYPTDITVLVNDDYISSSTCPGGESLSLRSDGTVIKADPIAE